MNRVDYSISFLFKLFCFGSIFFVINSEAQIGESTLAVHGYRIDYKKLKGVWHQVDSNELTIEFVDTLLEVTLKVKHDNPYYFSKDSLGFIWSSGYFPLWPPLDCDLNLLTDDTLKVTFSQMGNRGVNYLYVRQTPIKGKLN